MPLVKKKSQMCHENALPIWTPNRKVASVRVEELIDGCLIRGELQNREMDNPAASCGVSELSDEICLKAVTPEWGSRSDPPGFPLKAWGMTDFGQAIYLTPLRGFDAG